MTNLDRCPALVLNADFRPVSYFPLSLLGWQDTMKAVYEQTHVVVAEYDVEVRSPSITMKLPSVVALRNYVPQPRFVPFTRINVFLRDRFRCQYCNTRHVADGLTFDHVIPRAKGGETTWENIVSACDDCNNDKGCGEAMKPLRTPRAPTLGELIDAKRAFPPAHLHKTWLDFLYWDAELEK